MNAFGESAKSPTANATPLSGRQICFTIGNTIQAFDATQTAPSAPLWSFGDVTAIGDYFYLDLTHGELGFAAGGLATHLRTDSGNVPPSRQILGPAVTITPRGVALDGERDEIIVLNSSSPFISIFSRTASGNAPPLRFIDANSLVYPTGIAVDDINGEIAIANSDQTGSSVVVFDLTAAEDAQPKRILSLGLTNGAYPTAIAVDPTNDELLVGTYASPSTIAVYSRTATGQTSPLRQIAGASSMIDDPNGIALDLVHDEIVVSNFGMAEWSTVTVHARTANGNIAPVRYINGDGSFLDWPWNVAVDPVHDEIFVTATAGLIVYPREGSGGVAPLRFLSGAPSGLDSPYNVFVDTTNNELVIPNTGGGYPYTQDWPFTVSAYASSSRGAATPQRQIEGTAPNLVAPAAVFVDTFHDELFVANEGSPGDSVEVFHRDDDGNVYPLRSISGTASGILAPVGLFVDATADELFVLNRNASILVFARDADGNTSPLRTIAGNATFMTFNQSFDVDVAHNEIIVASNQVYDQNARLLVFDSQATGNVAPVRQIVGDATHLVIPHSVRLDATHDELFVIDDSLGVYGVNPNALRVFARTASGNTAPLREFLPPKFATSVAILPAP